ncbi:MAG: DegT/DnrJ/EryC1/StrS family aminotransferase [Myxococcota bacterium]
MIPLTRPWIGDAEIEAVSAVLRSGMLVQGSAVADFEATLAARTRRRHGIAVSSGTAALSLALEVLGVGPGDEVIVPALTWPSPAHAVVRCGATVRLVDVHPEEWNVTVEAVTAARTERTKAVIVIDQFGQPARSGFRSLDLPVIEDAACALGASFDDESPCGSLGVLSCLSFHPRKVLTTGEGGVILTDDDELNAKLRVLRNHGQSGPGQFSRAAVNYRLTEFQGALGRAQLSRLDQCVAARLACGTAITDALADHLQFQGGPGLPNNQTLGALVPEEISRDAFIEAARAEGVQIGRLSYALHQVGTIPHEGALPVTEDIVRRGIALPLYPQMTSADCDRVVEVCEKLLT